MAKKPYAEKAKPTTRSRATVSRREFYRDMDLAAGIVPAKSPIPILNNVLILVKSGKLHMRATNLDLELHTVCDIAGDADFSAAVNARKLREITALLPSEEFYIYSDQSAVRIDCDGVYYKMLATPSDKFPESQKLPDSSITLPPDFKDLIHSVLFSIGSESSRYAIQGAKLEIRKDGSLRLVATNGNTLSVVEINCDTGHELDCILPRQTLSMLPKLLEDGTCTMQYDESLVRFESGNRTLTSRTIKGVFPNYEQVLPSHPFCATVSREEFTKAIRRIGLCADDHTNSICATFRSNEIELKAKSQETGEAEEIVPADLSQEQNTETGFNAKYLRDFLAIAPEGDVQIYFKDGKTQFELRPSESRWTHRYVVMPMQLS